MLLEISEDNPLLPDSLIQAILQHMPASELIRLSTISKQWQIMCKDSMSKRETLCIGRPVTSTMRNSNSSINNDKLSMMSNHQFVPSYPTDFVSFFSDAQRRYRSSNIENDQKFKCAKSALCQMFPLLKHLTLYSSIKLFQMEQFIDNLSSIWPKLTSLTVMDVTNTSITSLQNIDWNKFCSALEELPNLCSLSIDFELPPWSKCSKFKIFKRLNELNTIIHLNTTTINPVLPYEYSNSCPNIRFGLWFQYDPQWNNADPNYEISVEEWNAQSQMIKNVNKLRIKLSNFQSVRWIVEHCRTLTWFDLTLYESKTFYREQFLEIFRLLKFIKSLKYLKLQFFIKQQEKKFQRQTSEPQYFQLRPVDFLLSSYDNLPHSQAFTVERVMSQFDKPNNIQNICQRDAIEIGPISSLLFLQIDFFIDPYRFEWIPTIFTNKNLMVKFILSPKNSTLINFFNQIRHEFSFQYCTS